MNTLRFERRIAERYKYYPLKKSLSEKYRQFYLENIPPFLKLNGDNVSLFSMDDTLICNGYERIVIGDYGAFIEFSRKQAVPQNYRVQYGQEYRVYDRDHYLNVKYRWLTAKDNSEIRIHFQKKHVKYADYIPKMYYVSPHEVKIITSKKEEKLC